MTLHAHSRFYAVAVLLLLLVGQGWGATYYVAPPPLGDAANDGLTAMTPKALPSQAITLGNTDVGGDGPHTMNIAAGTYAGGINLGDTDWNGAIISGAGQATTILAPTATHGIFMSGNVSTVTFEKITFTITGGNYGVYKSNGCDDVTIQDCTFQSASVAHAQHMIYSEGDTTTLLRCIVRHNYTDGSFFGFLTANDTDATIQSCIFEPPPFLHSCTWIKNNGASASLNFYNSVLIGGAVHGIHNVSGTTNVSNSVVAAGVRNSTGSAILISSGTVNLTNNWICANPASGSSAWVTGTPATDTGNIYTNSDPKFVSRQRVGYILPCVDDSSTFAYAQSVAAVLSLYGMKGTYFLEQFSWSGGNTAALRAMVAGGVMQVASHTYSHTSLTATNALTFTYGGVDTGATVTLTVGGVIQCRTNEHNDEFDLDTTTAAYDTLGEIAAADQSNWTIIKYNNSSSISNACLASSLASQGATAASPSCNIAFNRSGYDAGFFLNEVTNPKAWMADTLINGAGNVTDPQTGATYACRSLGCPYNDLDNTASAAVRNAGYILCRGNKSGSNTIYSNDYDLYAVVAKLTDTLLGGDEATVRLKARALAQGCIAGGLALSVLAHDVGEMSTDEWSWCCDEWRKFGPALVVTSHQIFADTVRNSGLWTDDGDGTYSRTYSTYTDYRLRKNSPCINAGTNLGDDYDLDFRERDQDSYGSGWEIGAYAFPEFGSGIAN